MPSKSADTATIEAEIDRIRSLGLDEIRNRWRKTLASPPPAAFSKDLIVRFPGWHLQEQAFGGLDPNIAKVLNSLLRGDKHRPDRRLKPGTVLVREYQGLRHTVTVAPDGYVWREQAYASLRKPLRRRARHHRHDMEWASLLRGRPQTQSSDARRGRGCRTSD